jgi:GNAT superfamily N-acetyltransferase
VEPVAASFRAWLPFFKCLPGAQVVDDGTIAYWTSDVPLPFFNGVFGQTEDVDAVLEAFDGRPLFWLAGEPNGLRAALEPRGFHISTMPGMTVDLERLPPLEPLDGVSVREVTNDPGALADATRISLTTNGFPESATEPFLEALGTFARPDAARTFLATICGLPVAASVLSTLSDAGLYNVGTLEPYRGRGLGRLVSLAALHAGRDAGFRRGVLGASPMGQPVYRALGFETTEQLTVAGR